MPSTKGSVILALLSASVLGYQPSIPAYGLLPSLAYAADQAEVDPLDDPTGLHEVKGNINKFWKKIEQRGTSIKEGANRKIDAAKAMLGFKPPVEEASDEYIIQEPAKLEDESIQPCLRGGGSKESCKVQAAASEERMLRERFLEEHEQSINKRLMKASDEQRSDKLGCERYDDATKRKLCMDKADDEFSAKSGKIFVDRECGKLSYRGDSGLVDGCLASGDVKVKNDLDRLKKDRQFDEWAKKDSNIYRELKACQNAPGHASCYDNLYQKKMGQFNKSPTESVNEKFFKQLEDMKKHGGYSKEKFIPPSSYGPLKSGSLDKGSASSGGVSGCVGCGAR
jgi:hypothetical protein